MSQPGFSLTGETGLFTRLGRLFGRSGGGGAARLPRTPEEVAFALSSRAEVLFSVFPERPGEHEDQGDPSRAFCLHGIHALRHQLRNPGAPLVVGLVGAGGSGKSTLFNQLAGADLSLVDILPHSTRGPVAVTGEGEDVRGLFHPLARDEATARRTRGDQQRLVVHRLAAPPVPGVLLVDLPDLNTRGAVAEGTVTSALLPWLDVTLVVCSVESFDRTVLDDSLLRLRELGSRLVLLFNRKGCRGPVAARDRRDLEQRALEMGAAGPFFLPDLRTGAKDPDDREALVRHLAGLPAGLDRLARRQALREGALRLGREALARHEARAEKAEEVLRAFKRSLTGLRERIQLEPLAVMPPDLAHVVADLRGLIGSPLEWLRRVARGQAVTTAFVRTFSLEARMKELEGALEGLRTLPPGPYVDRLRDHFQMVSTSLARAYRGLVAAQPQLFIEMDCRQDLVEGIFEPHRAAAARGFTSYRDRTVEYLDVLRERMLGPSSRIERALAVGMLLFLTVDLMVPGFSFVAYSGAYLIARTLGSEFTSLFTEHRALRESQRADLERCFDMLAQGLEHHFLRGDRYFGRMDVMEREERELVRGVLERLGALELGQGGQSA